MTDYSEKLEIFQQSEKLVKEIGLGSLKTYGIDYVKIVYPILSKVQRKYLVDRLQDNDDFTPELEYFLRKSLIASMSSISKEESLSIRHSDNKFFAKISEKRYDLCSELYLNTVVEGWNILKQMD